MNDVIAKQSCVMVSCKTLAQMLSISTRTAWRLLSKGELPKPLSIGGSKRWRMSDIVLFLECNCDMAVFQARKDSDNEL